MASHGTTESSIDGIKTDQTLWPKFGVHGWSGMTKWFELAHSKHVRLLWDKHHSICDANSSLNDFESALTKWSDVNNKIWPTTDMLRSLWQNNSLCTLSKDIAFNCIRVLYNQAIRRIISWK